MSTFDIRTDAPGLLRVESLNITIKFDRTGPTTGRVSWNIPTPAAGCTAVDQAYCGMLVSLDTTAATIDKSPVDGVRYTADPTADTNLFAGDKLGPAFVVGAFYNDRTTTFFDVTGLQPNTPYYVSGYPVDCQGRYFISGVHAYSQDFRGQGTDPTSSIQVVQLNSSNAAPLLDITGQEVFPNPNISSGIKLTDVTGLICGAFYQFTCLLGVTPQPTTPVSVFACGIPNGTTYTLTLDGCNCATYQDLVNEINKQFALIGNPTQSPFPPNANGLYWNSSTQKLFQWDGFHHNELPVIVQATDPTVLVVNGTYWYNPTTNILQVWNGATWTVVTVIVFATDPTLPICDKTYWFNGTTGYIWNGTSWCEQVTFVQVGDPSLTIAAPCGAYWYNGTIDALYKWNEALSIWIATIAIKYDQDPNTLPFNTYWFDETNLALYAWNNPLPGWNLQSNVAVSPTAPATPAVGKYWYNPDAKQLQQWDGLVWNTLPVISFPSDPTSRGSCDLWWDTTTNQLKVWDNVSSVWNVVTIFYQQPIDPTLPPTLVDGNLWYDPSTSILYVWQNSCFVPVNFISWATDPMLTIPDGTVWYDGTTWHVRAGGAWTVITPVTTTFDPSVLPVGTYWFNTTLNSLSIWNGVAWVNVGFSTTPFTPALNAFWFNTTTNTLMTWNGTTWVSATPRGTVEFDCNGNFLFTDTSKGSLSFISVNDVTLFKSLLTSFTIRLTHPGTDGVSKEPSYNELGVGTDGSTDERFKLMNEIRFELGYPVIDVELTQEQLDYCVSRAIEEMRSKTAISYKRGFFFMNINQETQRYLLTNRTQGFHKIVTVMGVYRLTSAFLSSAHGAGVYGQIVLQHLYNMGTFDLLSYDTIAGYVKLMEILFAARVTYTWDEQKRELWLHHRFPFNERMVAIEAAVERTEQDIISDRWCRSWIRRFALATSREVLAEVRGKFSTLPGAGGGITLNAADLRTRATTEKEALQLEIEDFIADKPEDYGIGAQFTFG